MEYYYYWMLQILRNIKAILQKHHQGLVGLIARIVRDNDVDDDDDIDDNDENGGATQMKTNVRVIVGIGYEMLDEGWQGGRFYSTILVRYILWE